MSAASIPVRTLAEDADETYVISNNHNLGKATVNALGFLSVLKGKPVPAPLQLLEHYPELRDFAEPSSIRSKV